MDKADQNYIRSTHLGDVQDLQRIARGVDMDIAQLDEGPFDADIVQLKAGNMLASRITSNRRLRARGQVAILTISLVHFESGSLIWHGLPAGEGDILAANAGEKMDLVVPPGAEFLCVSVIGTAETVLRNLGGPVLGFKLADTAQPIPCAPGVIRQTMNWLSGKFDELGANAEIQGGAVVEIEKEFLRRLAACLRAGNSSRSGPVESTRADIVHRVEEYLLDDLASLRTVDQLCEVAGTSRRTLEYAFRECFGTSPSKFVKAIRLNAARQDLLLGSRGPTKIVDVALSLGFSHMGQFSSDYRRMFGERPSDTLERGAAGAPA